VIYFVRNQDGGPVKIGTSVNLAQRLATLKTEFSGNFQVLGIMDGNHVEERRLHAHFSHRRLNREWFAPGQEIDEFIVANCREWHSSEDAEPKPREWSIPLGSCENPVGPLVAECLLRLGYADIVPKASKIAGLVSKKTGKTMTRQRISALMNAVHVEPETIQMLADSLGVEPEDLLED
jgi:hypothetical protein